MAMPGAAASPLNVRSLFALGFSVGCDFFAICFKPFSGRICLIFVEFVFCQRFDGTQRLLGIVTFGANKYFRARAGGQHH